MLAESVFAMKKQGNVICDNTNTEGNGKKKKKKNRRCIHKEKKQPKQSNMQNT